MPLYDHFHSPWKDANPWEGFHSAWVNTLVRQLNSSLLPRRFRAFPQTHLGASVEGDVVTIEQRTDSESMHETDGGTATAVWAPPKPVATLDIDFPGQDVYQVKIFDEYWGGRLAAVIELVSPGNKNRPESRQTFVAKSTLLICSNKSALSLLML